MKSKLHYLYIIVSVLFFSTLLQAQITNLLVNGDSTQFTMVSGEALTWSFNIDSGATARGDVWLDLNGNGEIDSTMDIPIYQGFPMTDGDLNGNNGPPDMDGARNGQFYFAMAMGLAPGHYILFFTEYSVSKKVIGEVTDLLSPAFTVSGTVTPPAGFSKKNILLQASMNNGGSWFALTDSTGEYNIKFDSTGKSVDWQIEVMNQFPSYICSPVNVTINTDTSVANVNFSYSPPSSKIVGYLKNESGVGIPGATLNSSPHNQNGGNGNNKKEVTTDGNGYFQFGYTTEELSNDSLWQIEADMNGLVPTYFPPSLDSIHLHSGDSVFVTLTAWTADDSITGKVTMDGHAPDNISFQINVGGSDSGYTGANSDPVTGNFTVYVTKKISNYYINLNNENIPQGYGFHSTNNQAHPGDANIILALEKIAWIKQQSNVQNYLNAVQFISPSTGWVVGDGVVLSSQDSGKSWQSSSGIHDQFTSLYFIDASLGWIAGRNGVVKHTTNGGGAWSSQTVSTNADLNSIYFISATHGWICGNNIVLRTTDAGTNWTIVNTGFGGIFQKVVFTSDAEGWIAGNMLLHTLDSGATWNQVTYPGGCPINDISFVGSEYGCLLFQGCGYNTLPTSDGGDTWSTTTFDPNVWMSAMWFLDTLNGWGVGVGGQIYSTVDAGFHWYPRFSGVSNSLTDIQFITPQLGWAVGDNGTILRTTVGGTLTGVNSGKQGALPRQYTLQQNFPNPFNPSTTVNFTVPEKSFITIKVYSLLGQEIATLVREMKQPGTYTVTWNAANVPSGVYFYRMNSNKFAETKKMLFIR